MLMQDKCVLVAGAGKPIGREISRKLVAEGAIVYLLDKDADKIAQIANEIDPTGDRAIAMPCDLLSETSVKEVFKHVEASDLSVDILVHATDIATFKSLEKLEIEEWSKCLKVNLTSVFMLAKECFTRMKENGGRIISIASLFSDEKPREKIAAYNVAKSGVETLMENIAEEWGQYQIYANTVLCPKEAKVSDDVLREFRQNEALGTQIVDAVYKLCCGETTVQNGSSIVVH